MSEGPTWGCGRVHSMQEPSLQAILPHLPERWEMLRTLALLQQPELNGHMQQGLLPSLLVFLGPDMGGGSNVVLAFSLRTCGFQTVVLFNRRLLQKLSKQSGTSLPWTLSTGTFTLCCFISGFQQFSGMFGTLKPFFLDSVNVCVL